MNKTEAIRVNVTPETRKALDRIAKKQDVSLATVIRHAITDKIKKENK
jgi:predicted transcriptional regulator